MTAPRAKTWRRGWRLALALSVVAIAALGISIAAYVRSGDRVVAFLAGVLARDYLIDLELGAPAEVAFWPQIALRLRDAAFRSGGVALLKADELRVRATWRSLFGGEVELTELYFDRPVVDSNAVAQWSSRYAALEQGPLPPLRVPTITTEIHARDLLVDGTHRFPTIELSPIARDRPVSLAASWQRDASSTWQVELSAKLGDTPSGIALDDLELDISDSTGAQLAAAGAARYDASAAWSFAGTLDGALLEPSGIDGALRVEIVRAAKPALSLVAKGRRADAAFDVDLDFAQMPPTSASLDAWLATLSNGTTGTARIDRLSLGEVRLEGVSFEATPGEPKRDE